MPSLKKVTSFPATPSQNWGPVTSHPPLFFQNWVEGSTPCIKGRGCMLCQTLWRTHPSNKRFKILDWNIDHYLPKDSLKIILTIFLPNLDKFSFTTTYKLTDTLTNVIISRSVVIYKLSFWKKYNISTTGWKLMQFSKHCIQDKLSSFHQNPRINLFYISQGKKPKRINK